MDFSALFASLVSVASPWTILGALLFGFIGFLMKSLRDLKAHCAENQRVLDMLLEQRKTAQASEAVDSDSDEISEDYRIPYFTDSEDDDELQKSSRSSGYNTESENYEQMLDIVKRAPEGPVSMDQTYLTFSCVNSQQFVKAIVDDLHSLIHIVTWTQTENSEWEWIPTTCEPCIQLVRRTLKDGNCCVPFAMDLEAVEDSEMDSEDVRRQLAAYEGEEEEEVMNETMCHEEDDDLEAIFKTTVFDDYSEEDVEEFQFNDEDIKDVDSEDVKESEVVVEEKQGVHYEEYEDDNKENEDVIEKPIPTLFSVDDFDFSHHEFEYDDAILED